MQRGGLFNAAMAQNEAMGIVAHERRWRLLKKAFESAEDALANLTLPGAQVCDHLREEPRAGRPPLGKESSGTGTRATGITLGPGLKHNTYPHRTACTQQSIHPITKFP